MLVLSAVVGSQAYGLAVPGSDVDRRGVFVAPTADFWRFEKPPTSQEGPRPEELNWEVERFCTLALRANPTALEVFASPEVEVCTDVGAELCALLPAFLSRRAAESYAQAAKSHLARVESHRASTGETRWKPVMHVIRLLLVCHHLVTTGTLSINATPHRDRLLAVRAGEVTWPEIHSWTTELHEAITTTTSPLPQEPDQRSVEAWLATVRRRALHP